jgi:hypothetical protein
VPLNSFIIQSLEASLSVQELIRLADEVVKESVEARTEMASQIGEMSQVVRRMSELMSESVEHSRAVSEELIRMDKARASTESVLRSFVEESQKHLPKDTFASITQAVRAANTETNDTKKKA